MAPTNNICFEVYWRVMKKMATFLLLFLFCSAGFSQSSPYTADVDALYRVVKQLPSFQDQITGDKKIAYDSLYTAVRNDSADFKDGYDYYYRLARLMYPIRDNHLGFYQFPMAVLEEKYYGNDSIVRVYKQLWPVKTYPRLSIDTDSLKQILKNKPKDSVEGIYYFGSILEMGLIRTGNRNELLGIVLSSSIPQWETGDIAARLTEKVQGNFRAIYGHPLYKNQLLYNNEKFVNHSLINSHFYALSGDLYYKKDTAAIDYSRIPKTAPLFELEKVRADVQRLRLGSFDAMEESEKISTAFFQKIKDSLTAQNLIVDLRDNEGGANRISYKFFTLIRDFAKNKKVFVLVNNGTMSQGEIFMLQLKALSNVKTLGQTTRGTIAYGSNFGKTERLGNGSIAVYLTDMRDTGGYYKYEDVGVEPEIKLSAGRDWIAQVLEEVGRQE